MTGRYESRAIIVSLPLLLAACGGGGGSKGSLPAPTFSSSYPIGAPAAASAGTVPPSTPATGLQVASAGGATFTGTGGGFPAPGTVFALTQSAYQFPAQGGSADTLTMASGATITVSDASKGLYELKIPNLGIDAFVKSDSLTVTALPGGRSLLLGINGDGATGTVLANLNYAALGNWVLTNASTGLATNMAYAVAGYQTPLASMPSTGSANYGGTGTVRGSVLIPNGATGASLAGDSALTANFAAGTVTGTFTNMQATPVTGGPPTAWNNVSVNASIAGTSLTGQTATATNPTGAFVLGPASGTIKGGFYGPAADEVAAVWTLYDGSRAAFGGVAGPKLPSDRRLKRDIRLARINADAIPFYTFRYFNDSRVFVGVMAQDLLADPRFATAVSQRPSGVLLVDYDRLGLPVADREAMAEAGWSAVEAFEAAPLR